MKKLLLILLCLPMIGFGQGWEKTFGGIGNEFGSSVQQTIDGGYIITGTRNYSFSNGPANGLSDVYLIKTNGNGDSIWTKTLGGTSWVDGRSIQQTSDEGYIITGGRSYSGNEDLYLIKSDKNGDSLWSKTYGGLGIDYAMSVQQTNDDGYIITGSIGGNAFLPLSDVYLIKTDINGDSIWAKIFGGTDDESGNSVQQTNDDGYIITGSTKSFGNGDNDIYLIKTDVNGDSIWTKTFGGTDDELGNSVQQTTDGGYIITGSTKSFGNGDYDIYLIKTDGTGDSIWTKIFGATDDELGNSVQQTTDGGYIITGTTGSILNGHSDVFLMKTDGNGDSLWTKTFGGAGLDMGSSVQQTSDGGYIIAGTSSSDVYLIKTDASGNITLTFNIPINPNKKLQKIVDLLGRESKPQNNIPFIEIYDDGTVEKKITID